MLINIKVFTFLSCQKSFYLSLGLWLLNFTYYRSSIIFRLTVRFLFLSEFSIMFI